MLSVPADTASAPHPLAEVLIIKSIPTQTLRSLRGSLRSRVGLGLLFDDPSHSDHLPIIPLLSEQEVDEVALASSPDTLSPLDVTTLPEATDASSSTSTAPNTVVNVPKPSVLLPAATILPPTPRLTSGRFNHLTNLSTTFSYKGSTLTSMLAEAYKKRSQSTSLDLATEQSLGAPIRLVPKVLGEKCVANRK
jgi:hypothetical protein